MRRHPYVALTALVGASFFLALMTGRYVLTPGRLLAVLQGRPLSPMDAQIFLMIRLPRVLTAMVCGAALSLAGFVYQELFRNPLASPDLLGTSGGASVGAICAILFGSGALALRQSAAMLGGLAAVALALLLAAAIGGNRYMNLVLAGIIVSAAANACIMALKYLADPAQELAAIDYWLMGSYSLASWDKLLSILPWVAAGTAALVLLRHPLQVATLGDEEARTLGLPVRAVRLTCIGAATVLVAASISIGGIVSWVGLLVPHAVRVLFGEHFTENFTETMLAGSALLLLADTAARTISAAELPISVLTTAIGAVCLTAFLIVRRRAQN